MNKNFKNVLIDGLTGGFAMVAAVFIGLLSLIATEKLFFIILEGINREKFALYTEKYVSAEMFYVGIFILTVWIIDMIIRPIIKHFVSVALGYKLEYKEVVKDDAEPELQS